MNHKPTAAIKAYWDRVARLGCVICKRPAQIAHAHSGSIVVRMKEPKAKGVRLRRYHWLVLPLCESHHLDTSPTGYDRNVEEWEAVYGDAADWIDRIAAQLKVDIWALANEGRK